jgi:prepilin-type N-terminal cleavage/methylation domain-containing protein/prepilin-type processing-associated H-X9-DG protein
VAKTLVIYQSKGANPGRSSGFSLVELLMVIAIVAILLVLLLPELSQSKQKGLRIQCAGNLHQQGIALSAFLDDNRGYPTWVTPTNSDPTERLWAQQLEHNGFGITTPPTNFWQNGVWRCPSGQFRSGNMANAPYYGYNVFGVLPVGNLTNNFGLSGHYTLNPTRITPLRETEVAVPAEMMAIGDSDKFAFMRSEGYDFYSKFLRHGDRANVVFCDSHVESPTLEFLFDDTGAEALSRWNCDHQAHADRL